MSFIPVALIVSLLKLLFLPTYRSTDFEVHRNWLAITHSLPIDKWYHESTSEWTLDYPPFFAWFEFVLSQAAVYFDPQMLVVSNLNYASDATVLFQRLSVIISDGVFMYASFRYCKYYSKRSRNAEFVFGLSENGFSLSLLLAANCGLLILDHIHFQYNGFLFGVLLLSIVNICEGQHIRGAFWFSVLLHLKHIYVYLAPAYFIFLLRSCFKNSKDGRILWMSLSFKKLISLGFVVIMTSALSLGPFIYMNQLPQLISRLFPFKRGLCHAYWAPNFWALYNLADKMAAHIGVRLGYLPREVLQAASMTGGLVQESQHAVLPSISPLITLIATVLSIIPAMALTWSATSGPKGFLRGLILCAFGAFMFGWHVHEKAILLVIIPLTLLAFEKKRDGQVFLLLSSVGHFSLFPLIFTTPEAPVKYCLVAAYTVFAFSSLQAVYGGKQSWLRFPLLNFFESIYLLGLIPLEFYCSAVHSLLGLSERLPFIPLLMTSCYCAVGVIYAWLKFYCVAFTDNTKTPLKKD
ncbi:hypothetical protein CAPTEDRAFT_4725 [Capitella teleta]|uniref:Alpha-1,3-glucosyltransferase n=1 Tax=Capitella teleta TaxID=283909 RepID=R7T4Z0_CAPTE|nr:hypothetical protein CAPTEDRAFT_4725 [Capitella teleta]|eukprot:ELT88001.1 hypothetical protein CAPTEDRAFT_4725 [Capitella teleta]